MSKNWFTLENTEGYTQAELDVLNVELESRLVGIEDPFERNQISKQFSDEVSRR
jgi:hypothetical protein